MLTEKVFKCDACLKKFKFKSALKIHYRIHTGEKPFACKICDRKFALKCNLIQHQATHSEVKSFKCSICPEGRFFKTKVGLNNHMVYHFEPKFACKICDRKFAQKNDLFRHQATHSDFKPFKCSICPEERYFKTKDGLNNHMVFHYEPKFSCNQCDYKSHTKSNLKQHTKTHDKK